MSQTSQIAFILNFLGWCNFFLSRVKNILTFEKVLWFVNMSQKYVTFLLQIYRTGFARDISAVKLDELTAWEL